MVALAVDFQLPLSGSPTGPSWPCAWRRGYTCFQLPLSGSPHASTYRHPSSWPRLSTPSFGITARPYRGPSAPTRSLSTPSFGITPGPCPPRAGALAMICFQLPLSGSPKSVMSQPTIARAKTFNSLFRDHPNFTRVNVKNTETFNSLFRDHRARFRDFSALRGFLPRHPFA